MAIEIIDVGSAPNDGQGDPIRTAYIKCNNNFQELYSRQQNPPATLNGSAGDVAGMYAFNQGFWYYCYQDFASANGTEIWQQISSEIPPLIGFGNSNVAASNTAVTISVNSVSNIAQFLANGAVFSNVLVSGNVVSQNLLPSANVQYDIGESNSRWRSLYLSGNTIYLGTAEISANASSITLTAGSGASFSVSGTSSSGNLAVENISANVVTANAFVGDGSALTNITAFANVAVTQIANGTSVLDIVGLNGNIIGTVNGTANLLTITPFGITTSNNLSVANTLTVSGDTALVNISCNSINALGNMVLTGDFTAGNVNTSHVSATDITATSLTSTGNITGPVLRANTLVSTQNLSATGNLSISGFANIGGIMTSAVVQSTDTTAAISIDTGALITDGGLGVAGNAYIGGLINVAGNANIGNIGAVNAVFTNLSGLNNLSVANSITANVGNISTLIGVSSLTVGGNLTVNNILNGNGGNGVGNIGNATAVFNTVFAKATSAQYADLAEKYLADAEYEPGTVVCFGGALEITESQTANDHRIAGVISAHPSYIMNSALEGEYVAMVALQGRVFCKVHGPVAKGDLLVSSRDGHAMVNNYARAGTILGKALQHMPNSAGLVEICVGKT